ncbi:MAG TPA: rRNA maturation RNase YbeY [Flavisolibacter sp.]|jgi:rRNA maturation RNase YbeY
MIDAQEKVRFHFLTEGFSLRNRGRLKQFLMELCRKEGQKVEAINYIFCDDQYLLQINKTYLKHDTYTDIVTFQLSGKGEPLLADIYISIERVKENAGNFRVSFRSELHRVIFHGALHLCGYKDKNKAQAAEMRRRENECLEKYFSSTES